MVFTRLTGFVVLGLALLLPAYAAPPYAFPDQPGVLSPAEKEDATRMMKMVLGTEPALPLVASGRRSPEHTLPGYALFAAPLAERLDTEAWMGARPCTPDMLPVIGRAPRHENLWFAFGHAHHGLTLGAVTGRLVAELVTGEAPFVDPAPYAAERFG